MRRRAEAAIERVEVAAYAIPTESPESDGTLEWSRTTLVVFEAHAGTARGLGYTYSSRAAASLIDETLAALVRGADALAPGAVWRRLVGAARNLGVPGIAATAISAIDTALWDLKARLLGMPLAALLGQVREAVPVYGSGGLTSYDVPTLERQLRGWAEQGMRWVKMKVGRDPEEDEARVRAARRAIGPRCGLHIDANGAYTAKQALGFAARFADQGVGWFEEPVSSDDREGLRLIRERAPAGMEVVAGEYVYTLRDAVALLGAVDVLTPDVTRCLGLTGLLQIAALAEAHQLPLATHCAPSLHVAPACATAGIRSIEYFCDHSRIEPLLFDGAAVPREGRLAPDLSRPGNGLELKRADAARFAI